MLQKKFADNKLILANPPPRIRSAKSKMARNKQATRKGNFNKHQQKGNQIDGPPPSKKAKNNPPPSSISLNTSNVAAPQLASASTTYQSLDAIPSEPTDQSFNAVPSGLTPQTQNAAPSNSPLRTSDSYDATSISIISSSHIQQKVSRVLDVLGGYEKGKMKVPQVVMMRAKAPCAAKMISIAEIAKREISKEGGKWFQYNKIEGVMAEVKKVDKGKEKGGEDENEGLNGDRAEGDEEAKSEEETTAFETMKTPFERANEGVPMVRAVPVMTLYLSRVRIDGLRKAYG